jgi:hypothetical protein
LPLLAALACRTPETAEAGEPKAAAPSRESKLTLTSEEGHGIPGMYLGGSAAGDFNGDGRADLVMAGYFDRAYDDRMNCLGNAELRVYTSKSPKGGPIRFERTTGYKDLGACGAQVVTGDFDGDEKLDFAVQIKNGIDTTAYFGKGDGTFKPVVLEKNFGTHSTSFGMAAADVDRDGKDDLIFASDGYADYHKAGKGLWYKWTRDKFQPKQTDFSHAMAYGGTLAAGDLDGDGYPEVAVAGNATVPFGDYFCDNKLFGQIHKNRAGTIEKSPMGIVANYALRAFGRADPSEKVNPRRFDKTCAGGDNVQYSIADVDRDGHNDLIVAGSGGFGGRPDMPGGAHYSFAILRNVDGTGTSFVTWENVGIGRDGRPGHLDGHSTNTGVGNVDLQSIAAGDLDGDGWPEIVIEGHRRSSEKNPGSYVYGTMLFHNRTHGDWVWLPDALSITRPIGASNPVIADFDGDGRNELLLVGAERPFHTNGENARDENTPATLKAYLFRSTAVSSPAKAQ